MKNAVQCGKVMNYLNGTGSLIASGAVVVLAGCIAVAMVAIPDGESGSVETEGAFTLAKVTGTSFAHGDRLFWDAVEKKLTKTAAGNTPAGIAFESAESAATSAVCKLSPATYGQAAVVTALGAPTAVTGVDGTGSNAASKADVDTRLTAIHAKLDAILTALKAAGLMASS